MKAASRHTGTVTAGISAARRLPRNSQITTSTSKIASPRVQYTRSIAASMKTVSSKATKMLVPSGSDFWISTAIARAARVTSSALAVEVLTMRSEEHKSELQSLMRISYAVFCLKHNKQDHITTHI